MQRNIAVCHGRFGRVALLQMQCPLVTHAHSQAHLLFHLGDTPAQFTVRNAALRLDRERYVAVNAWEPHSYPHRDGDLPLVLALYIEPAAIERVRPGGRFPQSEAALTPALRRVVHLISAEILHGDGSDREFLEERIDELLRLCLVESGTALPAGAPRRIADYRIRRSLEYMQGHVSERCDMADLARACGLSREHFFVRFQSETELTPVVYWNMLKMEQALTTLTMSRDPVCSIAYDLGFAAPGNFTRFFTRHQGVAPQDYRRAAQGVLTA